MYRDRTLVPAEAVRLLALGILTEGDRSYAGLAQDIRFFTQRIVGPSLDLLGSSLELLRLEGLIEVASDSGDPEEQMMRITQPGHRQVQELLQAQLRAPLNDIARLVVLLKLRFLDVLSLEDREEQLDLLVDLVRTEKARAADLAGEFKDHPLAEWLAFDVVQAQSRIDWLEAALDALEG